MLSVLIVDDNRDIHDIWRMYLESNSTINDKNLSSKLNIVDVYNGEDAINLIGDSTKFDLVVIDVRMPPGKDGVQVIWDIVSKHKAVNFVLCSAYSDYCIEEVERKFSSKINIYFLRKPFLQSEVDSVLQWAVELNKSERIRVA